MKNARLQTLLVERALVSPTQLADAVARTTGAGCTWLEHLLLTGVFDEEQLCRCVATAAWVECCDPTLIAQIAPDVLSCLPAEVAIEHHAVPVGFDDDGDLRIAMLDPTDSTAIEELGFFAGRPIVREAATATAIAWALHHYHGARSALWPRAQQRISMVA